ncbi:MAG: hypothetical protein ACRD29_10200 [Acidimicrobiales bacterium]
MISDGDIVGAGVNLASHLTSQAAPGAILCTEPVARALRAEHGVAAVARGSDRLGGLREVGIYELVAA